VFHGHSIILSVSGLDFPLSFQKNFEPAPLRAKVLSSNPPVFSTSESVVVIILSSHRSFVKSIDGGEKDIVEPFLELAFGIYP